MGINRVFKGPKGQTKVGYSPFGMDNIANFTSVCGYLLPVYWDYLEPGDKVDIKNILRTVTQPLTKPAMATISEKIEWFAVPLDQIYKPFKTKYFGINDVETDLLPTSGYSENLPFCTLLEANKYIQTCPTSLAIQQGIPVAVPTYHEVKRLFDCLGAPAIFGQPVGTGDTIYGSVSLLPFAAYQKIYYDHFRLTDRIPNDPQAYNLDSMYNPTGLTQANDFARMHKLFALRKRPYRLDYFTSMKTAPLMGSGDINAAGNDLGKVNQWLTGLSGVSTMVPDSGSAFPGGGITRGSQTEPTTVNTLRNAQGSITAGSLNSAVSVFNPANIRSMYAVEKLLEVTRRAKKHYDMQVLAHFGIDVPKGLAGECYKLGTHEQFISIGDVISSADTSTGVLGERAGRGDSKGFNDKPIKFEAKCHCILMAIYSAEPYMSYPSTGLDRNLSKTNINDFFKPEFDNLGMQPVFARELQLDHETSGTPASSYVVGWTPRYQENKAKYNRSFGGCAYNSFKEWTLNRDIDYTQGQLSYQFSRPEFFEVWPTDMNNILDVQYTGTGNMYSNVYDEDYLINQIYFDVTKVSKKSIYGVPNL